MHTETTSAILLETDVQSRFPGKKIPPEGSVTPPVDATITAHKEDCVEVHGGEQLCCCGFAALRT
eukprot:1568517-Amphidinium_carterae.2